ncbi:MAG: gamma carbonic anhydrase family protein [Acetobacteraceae bacterium]|nr:gamma carbonic anhydrase family protein [Acetobacteraceae bacterium]
MSFVFGPEVNLEKPAFVDPTARIFGRVSAGEGSSFWPYSVIRAEGAAVRIGRYCNIQDTVVIHVGGGNGTVIGDYVSIGHRAVVHGAEIGDDCLIGIGSVVMDRAKIGRRCVIGAMALVPAGMEVPEGSVVMGVPGKIVSARDNFAQTRRNALVYHRNALAYAQGRHDGWRGEAFVAWREHINKRLAAGEEVPAGA